MPRERLGIERILAATGVIISLLFVGYEIRQNTQVARATAVQEINNQIIEWATEAAHDPEWVRVITALYGGKKFSELSPEDRTRYNWVVAQTVRLMESRYRLLQLGVIDEADLGVGGGTSNPAWFQSAHFLEWWQSADREQSWSPDFLEFFETEVLDLR